MQRHPLNRVPLLILTAFLLASAAVADSAHGLAGTSMWMGEYDYPNSDRPATPFTLSLRTAEDGSFTGITTEPDTLSGRATRALTADVKGSISGDNMYFNKTYDGSGGETHTVQYTATLAADGRSMVGSWRTGNAEGSFSASRVSLTP